MAKSGKIEVDLEIQAPAEKYYHIFKIQSHHLPNISSDNLKGVDLHEGEWHKEGSIKTWKYTVGGREETYKEKIMVDDQKKSVTLVGLDGDVFKNYKSWKGTFQATPKDEKSCVVKHIVEYEKRTETVPEPHEYLYFMVKITLDIAAHLGKQA
ncbi:MLP-like protein 43 [Mangifera indica]|uniref:MLP-like protein 43 n=1 Tax=Mangifera indica TaxID=29780 RepID=UPI001CFAC401|nr:MLP-like protein 43 [Mangifera indica]